MQRYIPPAHFHEPEFEPEPVIETEIMPEEKIRPSEYSTEWSDDREGVFLLVHENWITGYIINTSLCFVYLFLLVLPLVSTHLSISHVLHPFTYLVLHPQIFTLAGICIYACFKDKLK